MGRLLWSGVGFLVATLAFVIFLQTGSDMKLETYKDRSPTFVLEDYFEGKTRAWGLFTDRAGNLKRDFVVDITGTWDEATRTLTLEEDFVYDDGEAQRRIWTIRKTGDNAYTGTAADVVGDAKGATMGNAFNWAYTLALPFKGRSVHLQFDDWMWLQPNGVLMNKATVKKWGFTVGEVTIFFQKQGEEIFGSMPERKVAANDSAQKAAE